VALAVVTRLTQTTPGQTHGGPISSTISNILLRLSDQVIVGWEMLPIGLRELLPIGLRDLWTAVAPASIDTTGDIIRAFILLFLLYVVFRDARAAV